MSQAWRLLRIVGACAVLAPGLAHGAEGDLDPTFGAQGKVVTVAGTDVRAFTPALAVQSDARIVASSRLFTTPTGERGLIVARYEANGTLDATFGTGGIVLETLDRLTFVTDAIVQSDGRIVLVGGSREDGGDVDWMLRRYEADGSVDTTFGAGGVVETFFSTNDDVATRVTIQPDGRIVVVGSSGADVAVGRYLADGSLDPTFGVGGVAVIDVGEEYGKTVLLQPDGRVIVGGGPADPLLARFESDGTLDATFGVGGIVVVDTGRRAEVNDAVLQADGSIIAGISQGSAKPLLMRFDSSGVLDASFGDAGAVELPPAVDWVLDLETDPAGNVLVGGGAGRSAVVVRFDADGMFDPTLSACGLAVTAFEGNVASSFHRFALLPDGGFLLGSVVESADGSQSHMALARFGTPAATTTCVGAPSGKSRLVLKPGDRSKWKWVSSTPLTTGEFGTPHAGTDVSFCVLDADTGAPLSVSTIPGTTAFCGTTNCWKATATGFLGQRQAPGLGKLRMKLVAPAGKPAKLVETGRAFHSGEPAFPLPTPVVARMKRGDGGGCWEATYSAPVKNAEFEGFLAFSD